MTAAGGRRAGRIDLGPQAVRQPERHAPRAPVVVGLGHRLHIGQFLHAWIDGELRVAATQPDVDRSGRELAGIPSAAADSASSRASRMAESSGALSRSANSAMSCLGDD